MNQKSTWVRRALTVLMLVSKILRDCPACGGKDCFGNVFVYCDHVFRGVQEQIQ